MKIFLKGTLCLMLALGMSLSLYAQTLHLVTVGDLRGFRGEARQGIIRDIQNVTSMFQKSVPAHQLNLRNVDGEMTTPNAIAQTIRNLNTQPDDVIVFYYSGHAANDSTNGGQFFQLRDEKGEATSMKRVDVKYIMQEKDCRLVVLLTDCCNVFDENAKMGFKLAPTRGSVKVPTPAIQELFFNCKGVVDITSSKVGQYSYALKDGSIFTVAMVMSFEKMNNDAVNGVKITWQDVANDLTEKSSVLFKEKYPKGAPPQNQRSQVPHVYAYPGIPRLGISVLTQSVGNVRIEEVVPGFPGEKAGLRVRDVITFVNGQEVLDEREYAIAIDSSPTKCTITFKRNDQEMKVEAELNGEPREVPSTVSAASRTGGGNGGSASLDPSVYGNSNPQNQNTEANAAPVNNGPIFGVSIQGNTIVNVLPNSPASAAGLGIGDQILQMNGQAIRTGADFERAVDASPRAATLMILKKGDSSITTMSLLLNKPAEGTPPTVQATQTTQTTGGNQVAPPATQPTTPPAPSTPSTVPVFGVSIQADGNRVVAVIPNSPAANIGIEVQDQILQFNGATIHNGSDFSRAVDASGKNAQLVIRDHRTNKEESIVVQLNK
ncbi:MAG: PDZ domain-containing protein [Planctomycetia bacterium]|nr:PDZ domain-containing protein [Planctomycetia bacterium]